MGVVATVPHTVAVLHAHCKAETNCMSAACCATCHKTECTIHCCKIKGDHSAIYHQGSNTYRIPAIVATLTT